jgi:hypothetical protein
MKSFKSFSEEMTFKVDVEGLPAMYVNGNSPGEVKAHLRKLVKQPSMIKSVKRQTKHDVKKMYRDKAQGKNVEEAVKYTHVAVDKKGKVAGMASKASDAKDMARRHGGTHHQLKKPMHPKVGDMMINKSYNPVLTKEMTQQSKTYPNLKIAVGKSAQSAKDTKARADKRKANKQGTSLAADTSGNVDYGSDKSIKMMKKVTPGEANEGNGLWANIHAKRKRGEKMRKKGEKGAPTPAAIASAQKNEKITIGKIRRAAYKTAKVLGDVNAVKKGKVARRVKNRVVGKMLGKAVGKLGLFK